MARVTVEDCLEKVDNRFELILIASKRAHQLSSGTHKTTIDRNGDKDSVIALREIAAGLINSSILEEVYNADINSAGVDMAEIERELSDTTLDAKDAKDSIININEGEQNIV